MGKEREQITPILRQYYDLKAKHPDAILLFRSGDFYEVFEEDAKVCSNILDITLTRKNEELSNPDPNKGYQAMFPHHALDIYLPKLIRAGKRVAICDQLELPKKELKKKSIKDML